MTKILNRIEDFVIISGLALIAIILLLQVFMRYIFNYPFIWSEELARYTFVWVSFIGMGYGIRQNCHIRMEIVQNKLPKKMKDILNIFMNIIACGAFMYLIPSGIELTIQQQAVVSSAMAIPMGYVFIAVPVGFSIGCLRMILMIINDIRSFRKMRGVEA
ncbi:TRAP transporter small permease [Geosporobacter ferrireducens]|uniref:Tripartite ATP-independent periplasmic transporters DctQ component domain-containing protein n=1 Tax=Geosporobacter ferrireducens TaxID=1424294 RepID=A0A1D8GM88_9FIRM|nr:TRAP transporter small permease [Geosporobacter ferrireducens]AOT72030.1 hypothetical protein Gferi_22320 [Geosporobacter ferrireducens]MTI55910.1 TRAP transporter small permease [Geosporobacter ferrireducens]